MKLRLAPLGVRCLVVLGGVALIAGCGDRSPPEQAAAPQADKPSVAAAPAVHDPHSHANPDQVRVEHLDLVLEVDFKARRMNGTADLHVRRVDPQATELVLDTDDLDIDEVALLRDGVTTPLEHSLGARDPITGSALTIKVPRGDDLTVRVTYRTRPTASGLQWLDPPQTAGRKYPFLFTQSEAIHARTWVPLQDTPHVRMTYTATVRVPKGLTAVMAAAPLEGSREQGDVREFRFRMPQKIPSYLLALGIGDLEFRRLGPRTGVYAERPLIDAAAREFADTESMLSACEKLFGPYRWERYDLLVLPPSFPIGGMENPRLSFITPTVIAGDKSLTSVIAHELAHSWSGNLVTNATWRDLWLNEGFTVFLERRILETLYGEKRRQMEELLGLQSLQQDFAELKPAEQVLAIDLTGRDPDDVFSQVPYEKGYLFLRYLESKVGREAFDTFLHGYFDHFAFQSITTEQFLDYLRAHLALADPQQLSDASIEQWLHEPALPADAVLPSPDAFAHVDAARLAWFEGKKKAAQLDTGKWTTHEWLHFLDNMPGKLSKTQLDELERTFHFNASRNAEIASSWLVVATRNQYDPAVPRLEEYLVSIGRQKLIKPLYKELEKTPWGKPLAMRIYAKARPGYQVQTQTTIDEIVLGKQPPGEAQPT